MGNTAEIRLPRAGKIDRTLLEALGPAGIHACDFAVAGAVDWVEIPAGYRSGRILNIDHHSPSPRWFRQISSTNLAMAHVEAYGTARDEDLVVIDHTDCDSILSAGIMSARLPPLQQFGAAAIAADHTGAADDIADLLQAIEHRRDLELSFESLADLLSNRTPTSHVQADLDKRVAERARAQTAVERGEIRQDEYGFAWGRNDDDVDAALFPGVMPQSKLILLIRPFPGAQGRWECKLRLGPSAPEGLTLFELQDREPELSFGGRWNAGSNKYRPGGDPRGTGVDPEEYAARLRERLVACLSTRQRAQ